MTDRKGRIQAYAHRSCSYVRTSSTKYSLKPQDLAKKGVHLVNDGVQNKEESYGKFEEGNKLALADFAPRVDAPANWLEETLIPRMEAIMRYTIDAAHARLNPKKRQACFELLGFDFMLDADLRVDLIEINSNPCLEGVELSADGKFDTEAGRRAARRLDRLAGFREDEENQNCASFRGTRLATGTTRPTISASPGACSFRGDPKFRRVDRKAPSRGWRRVTHWTVLISRPLI